MTEYNISTLSLEAHAKLNLFLEILGKRDDGYHEISTVMQEINLADELIFEVMDEDTVILTCYDQGVPAGEENIVWKAAWLIKKRADIKHGVKIHLTKRIPIGAGLGGGSSDAATTLKGLNTLWQIGLNDEKLTDMAAELGSDVPFFIKGKTALCKGRGELVSQILCDHYFKYILIYPDINISTGDIYRNLKLDLTKDREDVSFFINVLKSNNLHYIGKHLFNRLEETIFSIYPELLRIKRQLKRFNFCGLQVSGSGSALFGLCERRCNAKEIKKEVEQHHLGKVFVVTNELCMSVI